MVERFKVRLLLDADVNMTMLDEVAHLRPVLDLRADGTCLLEVSVLMTTHAAATSYVRARLETVGADGHLAAA